MVYTYKKKHAYKRGKYTKKIRWESGVRQQAKRNLVRLIKETTSKECERKQFSQSYASAEALASNIVPVQLTDIPVGTDNNTRVGNEVEGIYFDVLLSLFNTTNNDLFVRVALLELAGRGSTGNITKDSGIFRGPNGNVVTFEAATTIAANAGVMYEYDKGSCTLLKEKVYKIGKNNGGSSTSSRTVKWRVPWSKKIRFVDPTHQGEFQQNKRVTLVVTAWSPAGSDQSTYTYDIDGICKFYFKDT